MSPGDIRRVQMLLMTLLWRVLLSLAVDQCKDRCTEGFYCDYYLGACELCRHCVENQFGCEETCTRTTSTQSMTPQTLPTGEDYSDATATSTPGTPVVSTNISLESPAAHDDLTSSSSIEQTNSNYSEVGLFFGLFGALLCSVFVGYHACYRGGWRRIVGALKGQQNAPAGENPIELQEILINAQQRRDGEMPSRIADGHDSDREDSHADSDVDDMDVVNTELPPTRRNTEPKAGMSAYRDSGYHESNMDYYHSRMASGGSRSMPGSLHSQEQLYQTARWTDQRIDMQHLQCARPPRQNNGASKTPDIHRRVQDGTPSNHDIVTSASPFQPFPDDGGTFYDRG